MSFGFNLCHYYLADLKMALQENADVRESAPVKDRGSQTESRLNGGELLSQYDSVVGRGAGNSGTGLGDGLQANGGRGNSAVENGQLVFSNPYGGADRNSGEGKSWQVAQAGGVANDASPRQMSLEESSFNRSRRTDVKGASAAADSGQQESAKLSASPSFTKDGSLSQKDQDSLFKAAEGIGNKNLLKHFENYVNQGLKGSHQLQFSREFAQDGKATNVINVVGQDGKPAKQYRK